MQKDQEYQYPPLPNIANAKNAYLKRKQEDSLSRVSLDATNPMNLISDNNEGIYEDKGKG